MIQGYRYLTDSLELCSGGGKPYIIVVLVPVLSYDLAVGMSVYESGKPADVLDYRSGAPSVVVNIVAQ